MKHGLRTSFAITCLLLLQLAVVHEFHHDTNPYTNPPSQTTTHADSQCLLSDTATGFMPFGALALCPPPYAASVSSVGRLSFQRLKYLTPLTRAPPIRVG
jgi:hypothetical protein